MVPVSASIGAMQRTTGSDLNRERTLAWCTMALVGVAVPVLLSLALVWRFSPSMLTAGPVFTLGLMGVGIIAAAITGRLWVAILAALLNAACLFELTRALGWPAPVDPLITGLAMVIAAGSFCARGALFARTLAARGWWMALFVVAGEGSVLLISTIRPDWLPAWFLALLPAQWANIAIEASLTGTGVSRALVCALTALGGTAVTTLLAARFWLKRWPYAFMFSAWLALSALVYFGSVAPVP